uniref:Uncharacterized protein n=1 Tax=Arundo donax TaxID=35708 RepID=A0A0A9AN82_ARUDO
MVKKCFICCLCHNRGLCYCSSWSMLHVDIWMCKDDIICWHLHRIAFTYAQECLIIALCLSLLCYNFFIQTYVVVSHL